MIAWLSQWVDYNALTDIESAPFSPDYYGDLLLAMESTIIYGDVAICFLPHAHGAEIVGEVSRSREPPYPSRP